MTKIKVMQVGCGKMSKYTMRYVYEKGAEIVGAVDINEEIIGQDISKVMETKEKGIIINNIFKLDEILKETKPDIAIITTQSLLNDIKELIRTIISNKVNVITTCEEAFFAYNSNPNVVKELDIIAKANGVTITGCGYQDVAWGNLITTFAGTTHKITKIKGSSSYNIEDYGIALAEAHGAGLTLEEFKNQIASSDEISAVEREKMIENGKYQPSYMWNTVGWLADKLNLRIKEISQKCVAQIASDDIHSDTLKMDIKKGDATGMSAIVTAKCEENIIIEAECIGKVYNKEEFDKNEWTIYGEPNTTVIVNRPATVELTCADIVNRITDVIKAKAGFIPTSKMPSPSYKKNSLETYI